LLDHQIIAHEIIYDCGIYLSLNWRENVGYFFFFSLCSLSENQISKEGAFALAGALQVNQSLQTLKWVQTYML